MKSNKITAFMLLLMLVFGSITVYSKTFVHPGILHKKSDLDRMKAMINSGKQPWAASFAALRDDYYSKLTYNVRGVATWDTLSRENPAINRNPYEDDATVAYHTALLWYFTGDQRYADKSIEILNRWNNLKYVQGIPLGAGLYGAPLINAAEIIKNTNAGWAEADIQKFKDMLVYPGYSSKVAPTAALAKDQVSFYWKCYMGDPNRAGNQDIAAFKTLMAIGIFLDNDTIYQRALRYVRGQSHLPYDLPQASGPSTATALVSRNSYQAEYSSSITGTTPDWGYDGVLTNYIYDNGQCQESSRDQVHTLLGIELMNNIAEMAWNQGDDLYGWADNRLLLGYEYSLKYNLSFLKSYEDQASPWEPLPPYDFYQGFDETKRRYSYKINPWVSTDTTKNSRGSSVVRPYYEMALNHYQARLGVADDKFKWLKRTVDFSVDSTGTYETRSDSKMDCPGWGTLTYRRADNCPGDPVTFLNKIPDFRMNTTPCKIEAEDYDFFTADGQGRTYYDLSETKIANDYRNDSVVTLKPCSAGGYNVSDMKNGEWLNYSVYFPEYSQYQFAINYSAATTGGAIKIQINGEDKITEISLPATGEGVWADFVLPQTITLLSGVQSVRIVVLGTSNTVELNSISISKAMVPAANDYVSKGSGDFNTGSSWYQSDGAGGYKSTQPYTAPSAATNVWIQKGHTMTAKTNSKAKNLFVAGTLTLGASTSTAYSLTLGTSTTTGSLYVLDGGVFNSTTANGTAVGNITVTGSAIQIDGQLGSVDGATTAGSGLSITCENPEITTIGGRGKLNIVRILSGAANTYHQDIVIDIDANLMNSATNGAALSLLNGNADTGNKTLTINENKKVSFTGGSVGLLHQMSSATGPAYTGGNVTYNILGALDTGNGGLYLTTSTMPTSSTQNINVNVGSNGTLAIGSKFLMIKSQSTQAINLNFAEGSTVQYSGSSTPVYSSTAATGVSSASFPIVYSNLIINSAKGLNLSNSVAVNNSLTLTEGNIVLGANNLTLANTCVVSGGSAASHIVASGTGAMFRSLSTGVESLFPIGLSSNRYDPVMINPLSDAVLSVRVDSVFSTAPDAVSLTNPVAWNVVSMPAVVGKLTLMPSVMTNINSPVVGQNTSNKWNETEAVKDANGFSATLALNGQFGTGSFSGFGQLSATNALELEKVQVSVVGKVLMVKNLSGNTLLNVISISGQQVLSKTLNTNSENVTLPAKGIFLIRLSTNDSTKVYKIIAE